MMKIYAILLLLLFNSNICKADNDVKLDEVIEIEKKLISSQLPFIVAKYRESVNNNLTDDLLSQILFKLYLIDKEYCLKISKNIFRDRKEIIPDLSDPLSWNELMENKFKIIKFGSFIGLKKTLIIDSVRINNDEYNLMKLEPSAFYREKVKSFIDDLKQ